MRIILTSDELLAVFAHMSRTIERSTLNYDVLLSFYHKLCDVMRESFKQTDEQTERENFKRWEKTVNEKLASSTGEGDVTSLRSTDDLL